MTIAEVVNRETASAPTNTEARTNRGFSFGKGAVGDKALIEGLSQSLPMLGPQASGWSLTLQIAPIHQICLQQHA